MAKRKESYDDFSKPQQKKKRQKRERDRPKPTSIPQNSKSPKELEMHQDFTVALQLNPEMTGFSSSDKLRDISNSQTGIPIPSCKPDTQPAAEFPCLQTPNGDISPEDSPMTDRPPAADESADTAHITCFGVVISEASFILKMDRQISTISLITQTGSNGVLKFFCRDSKGHLGSLSIPTLTKLAEKLSLTLTAFPWMHLPCEKLAEPRNLPLGPSWVNTNHHFRIQLRIVIHGVLSNKTVVGDTLSKSHIFLQHPYESECLPEASYQNPHCFVRPGSSMPRLENLQISSQGQTGSKERHSNGHLTEADKSQILKLFDTTTNVGSTASIIKPSPRLVTILKDQQRMALSMMAEKECGVHVDKAKFPQLWEKTTSKDGKVQYMHTITGVSREVPPDPVRGGILADEMGLGKTLSTLALIAWHLDALDNDNLNLNPTDENKRKATELRTTLIVTPKSTIHEWTQQIQRHIAPGKVRLVIYHGDKGKKLQLANKLTDADIVLTTYDTLRSDAQRYHTQPSNAQELLTHQTWARVILDEAHTIRNRSSQIFKILSHSIRSPRRWCLTGTPIHNSLDDFGSLLAFIRAKPFDTHESFNFWILQPFTNDRARLMFSKSDSESNYALVRLRRLIAATCLRRTKKGLLLEHSQHAQTQAGEINHQMQLPEKREVMEELELDGGDLEVYRFFKKNAAAFAASTGASSATATTATARKTRNASRNSMDATGPSSTSDRGRGILPLIGILRLICNHGVELLPETALKAWRDRDSKSVNWQTMQDTENRCQVCRIGLEEVFLNDLSAVGTLPSQFSGCGHLVCSDCATVSGGDGSELMEMDDEGGKSVDGDNKMPGRCPVCIDDPKDFPTPRTEGSTSSGSPGPAIEASPTYRPSAKVRALLRNLEKEQADGKEVTKSVVFSYWTRMLDLVERLSGNKV